MYVNTVQVQKLPPASLSLFAHNFSVYVSALDYKCTGCPSANKNAPSPNSDQTTELSSLWPRKSQNGQLQKPFLHIVQRITMDMSIPWEMYVFLYKLSEQFCFLRQPWSEFCTYLIIPNRCCTTVLSSGCLKFLIDLSSSDLL